MRNKCIHNMSLRCGFWVGFIIGQFFENTTGQAVTAPETIRLLLEAFPSRVISRFSDSNWPPRSYHLKPLKFYAKRSWKISPEVYVVAIYPIWYSIHNPILFTLWINKKNQYLIKDLCFLSKLLLASMLGQPVFSESWIESAPT